MEQTLADSGDVVDLVDPEVRSVHSTDKDLRPSASCETYYGH